MSVRSGPRYQASRRVPSRTKPQRSATRIEAALATAACRSRRTKRASASAQRDSSIRARRAMPRPRSPGRHPVADLGPLVVVPVHDQADRARAAGRPPARRRPGRGPRRTGGAPARRSTKSRASSARRRASARACTAGRADRWHEATSDRRRRPVEGAQHHVRVRERRVGQRRASRAWSQGRIATGVPARTSRASRTTSALRMRMQPWLARVPISSGRLVPWMATRPSPPANSLSVSE